MITKFELDDVQQKELNEWLNILQPEIVKKQKEIFKEDQYVNRESPYYGAIGGGLTYTFTPTGLGTFIKVKEYITQKEIDLSHCENW